ncbi:Zinc finger protein jing [Trichinella pseudospiralis]
MLQSSYLLNRRIKSLKVSTADQGSSKPPLPSTHDQSRFNFKKLSRRKFTGFDVNKKSGVEASTLPSGSTHPHHRRGSFLYRIDSDAELTHSTPRVSDSHKVDKRNWHRDFGDLDCETCAVVAHKMTMTKARCDRCYPSLRKLDALMKQANDEGKLFVCRDVLRKSRGFSRGGGVAPESETALRGRHEYSIVAPSSVSLALE